MRYYIQDVARHSTIYTISSFLTKAVGIVLIPIYTRVLTPDDYGIIAIVVPLIQAFFVLFSLGIPQAANRLYFDFEDRSSEQKSFFGTVLIFMSMLGFILGLAVTFLGEPIFVRLFPGINFHPFGIMTVWIGFFMLVYNFKLTIYRVRKQSILYGIFSVVKFAGIVALTILTVVFFRMGAYGRVLSELIVVIVLFTVIWILVLKDISLKINTAYLKSALKYALPIVPHALSGIILSLAAKFFLNINDGLTATGIYNIGFLVASIMNMIVYSINQSWVPFFMKLAKEKEDEAKPIVAQLTTYYLLFIFFVGLALSFFSSEIVQILTTDEYTPAVSIVPILTLQYILTGAYYMMISKIVYIKTAVKYLPVMTISSAGLNILMNYLLTPVFGIEGAAWSAVTSSGFLLVFAYFVSQRVFFIRYETKRILLIVLSTIMLLVPYYLLSGIKFHVVFAVLIKLLLLGSYLGLLFVMGFFRRSELKNLKDIYVKVKNRYT